LKPPLRPSQPVFLARVDVGTTEKRERDDVERWCECGEEASGRYDATELRERLKGCASSSDESESRRKESCDDEARWVKCRSTIPAYAESQRLVRGEQTSRAHQRRSD
jgi:hypothetical protein